ncbi:clasp N-terminal domain-containing protein, partial [Umbelopsis sp. PMI_123]
TEETWEQFDVALKNVAKWTKEGATSMEGFIPAIKTLKEPIVKSLLTERSRLSGTTTDLLEQLAINLQRAYEPLSDGFLPHIMKLFTRSNKLFVNRGIKCVSVIIQYAKIPRAIPQFCNAITKPDPNKQMRMGAAQCLTSSIEFNASSDLENHLTIIENAIRVGAMDSAPEVREMVRKCFEMYKKQLPEPSVM